MTALKKRRLGWPLIVMAVIVVVVVATILVLSGRGAQGDWGEAYRNVEVEAVAFQDSVEV